ncbi:MAG: hypothetical protein VX608_00995, partial [Chloroflexota bacterium]|nr:hypothetical protein [Chloroflexota bacterium]
MASGGGGCDFLLRDIKTRFNTGSEVCGVLELTAASLIVEATHSSQLTVNFFFARQAFFTPYF